MEAPRDVDVGQEDGELEVALRTCLQSNCKPGARRRQPLLLWGHLLLPCACSYSAYPAQRAPAHPGPKSATRKPGRGICVVVLITQTQTSGHVRRSQCGPVEQETTARLVRCLCILLDLLQHARPCCRRQPLHNNHPAVRELTVMRHYHLPSIA